MLENWSPPVWPRPPAATASGMRRSCESATGLFTNDHACVKLNAFSMSELAQVMKKSDCGAP